MVTLAGTLAVPGLDWMARGSLPKLVGIGTMVGAQHGFVVDLTSLLNVELENPIQLHKILPPCVGMFAVNVAHLSFNFKTAKGARHACGKPRLGSTLIFPCAEIEVPLSSHKDRARGG